VKLLLLGHGKTGAVVEQIARERGHDVRVATSAQNQNGAALTPDALREIDVVIDFTTPHSVVGNIEACMRARARMVVGTTGWYDELGRVRELVEQSGGGFVYASNFSVGVNLVFEIARAAAGALQHGYLGQIFERHHAQKKDAPSGTAVMLQKAIREASGHEVEIISFREGEVVGMHELVLDSPNDTIYLCHDAKSRRGFAEGAVVAAEWLRGRTGFHEFRDVLKSLTADERG